jgi:hypothetical protein
LKKAKIKITGIPEQKEILLKVLNKAIKDPALLNELGQIAVDQIKRGTRGRLDVYKQPSLLTDTKDTRERLIRAGNAFDRNIVKQPSTSNLSMSGQLLNAIYYRVNQALGTITLLIRSPRTPYKGIRKAQLEGSLDNNEVKDNLETIGRKFFFISDKVKAILESKVKAKLRSALDIYKSIKRR